jgi:hypothetical protein
MKTKDEKDWNETYLSSFESLLKENLYNSRRNKNQAYLDEIKGILEVWNDIPHQFTGATRLYPLKTCPARTHVKPAHGDVV